MYFVLILVLLSISLLFLVNGMQRKQAWKTMLGLALAVLTVGFFWFMGFWGEALWFEAAGYSGRFWRLIAAKALSGLGGGLLALGAAWLLTLYAFPRYGILRWLPRGAAAILGGMWGWTNWKKILFFWYGVSGDVNDPILNRDVGFYLFKLPLLDQIYRLLLILFVLGVSTLILSLHVRWNQHDQIFWRLPDLSRKEESRQNRVMYWGLGIFFFVLAWGKYLDQFHLLYSDLGVVRGAGWTDVHVRLHAYRILVVFTAAAGLLLFVPAFRRKFREWMVKRQAPQKILSLTPALLAGFCTAVVWVTALWVVPMLFQWLYVQPNEISLEVPYIAHNIALTRQGFDLEKIQERRFPVTDTLTREMVEDNQILIENVRLWDWRALDQVYKQFQEIRLYYEFIDVDVDRYTYNGRYNQVMVSAREMRQANLPAGSRTFVNTRFKYTHGFGITLTPVSRFTPQGLPDLLVKDIPPVSEYPELEVEQPRIYYGELTDSYVVANSSEPEFDYPMGEENAYNRYDGRGGVVLSSLWRKFLFGWKFDGTRFFFSSYPTRQSRILFHRRIRERVEVLAPFLSFDDDPYIVLAEGRLYWIVDAYTTSDQYPYSEPITYWDVARNQPGIEQTSVPAILQEDGEFNYIRNSVKTVVDVYHGTVDFYVFEPDDPLIQTWERIFPDLFKPGAEMPEALLRHIRYPSDLLLIQGLIYAKYHMTNPVVFYNQEDLWVRATEKYYGRVQTVDPYYIMWEPPGTDQAEFILMIPFTPKNRQVLIGWIAGLCDPDGYGELVSYKFPKEKRVLGTQQMETKIDQNPVLSARLSLWDQRGSRVIRGNVLVIPIDDTLLYVEPIYLQAQTAAYPELRLVTLMHNDRLEYAPTFEAALNQLLGEGPTDPRALPEALAPLGEAVTETVRLRIRRANEAFESYLQLLGRREYRRAAEQLEILERNLQGLLREGAGETPNETDTTQETSNEED